MEQIFDLIFENDDVTWKSLIYELVKSQKMDPWDVDIALLTKKYLEMLRQLKDMDFRMSGKVVLAAAILLKLKSKYLLEDEVNKFDQLFQKDDDNDFLGFDDAFFEEFSDTDLSKLKILEEPKLIPRTPQPRKRKVSVYDLMDALQKAMDGKKKRISKKVDQFEKETDFKVPTVKFDITQVIRETFTNIKTFFLKSSGKLSYSMLVPKTASRDDKVYTFIPLLHLRNDMKIDLHQEKHFGDIDIELLEGKKI